MEDDLIAAKHAENQRLLQLALLKERNHVDQCNVLSTKVNQCIQDYPGKVHLTGEALDCTFPENLHRLRVHPNTPVQLVQFYQVMTGARTQMMTKWGFMLKRNQTIPHYTTPARSCFLVSHLDLPSPYVETAFYFVLRKLGKKYQGIRCVPSMLIIGVQKGGTTELRNMLVHQRNPAVGILAPWKLEGHILDSSPHNPIRSMLQHSIIPPSEFLNLQVYFEKTPRYFDSPFVPLQSFQGIDLVALLKEPASRLFSSYWNSCLIDLENKANCSLGELEHTIFHKLASLGRIHTHGLYDERLEAIKNKFSVSNTTARLFLSFSDHFETNTSSFLSRLSSFLHLEHTLTVPIPFNTTNLGFSQLRATGYAKPSHNLMMKVQSCLYNSSLHRLGVLLRQGEWTKDTPLHIELDLGVEGLPKWIP